jgi:charged multivesicular body protein 6
VELEVFNGLRKGNEILGEIQKEMSLEEVELLMQETAEAIDYQNVPIFEFEMYLDSF